jgi:hypothetical protein
MQYLMKIYPQRQAWRLWDENLNFLNEEKSCRV